MPRVIRLNTTQFAVIKTGDKNQLKQIYNTFANTIEFDKFERMYKKLYQNHMVSCSSILYQKKNTRDFVVDLITPCLRDWVIII